MRYAFLFILAVFPQDPEEDLQVFTCPSANFKVGYPGHFRKIKPPREEIQLGLSSGANVILFCAAETPASIEAIVESVQDEQKLLYESLKIEKQTEIKVAGERAVSLRMAIRHLGINAAMTLVVFTHHGFAYRIVGVNSGGNEEKFAEDLQKCLSSFGFIAERKDWVEKFEGKPVKAALLGGLATFELRRPRWSETLGEDLEYGILDQVTCTFITQGAWVHVRAREATGPIEAASDRLRHFLASTLQKTNFTEAGIKVAGAEARAFGLTGEVVDVTHTMRGAVVDRDGVRLELWMDCLNSLREVAKPDWEALIASLALHARSAPPEPPAYPCRPQYAGPRPDPGLAAFLDRAHKLAEQDRGQLLGVSSDGATALIKENDVTYRVSLPGGRREKLPLATQPQGSVSWSKNGKRIAYIDGDRILIADLDPLEVRVVQVAAENVIFGPGEDDLLVCTKRGNTVGGKETGSNRLELYSLSGELKKTLIAFPFSHVTLPAVSSDGRIAIVTNRDAPRRTQLVGHLYVVAADGSDLRQLTRDPEEISSVAWSPEGKSIYAVRRLSVGKDGGVGLSGGTDLHRISVETGQAVNLTRCGGIGGAMVAREDLLLKITGWQIPASQQGLFRISAADLEKATAGRRVPPVVDPERWSKDVADRVFKSLGTAKSLRDTVPTVPMLESAAKAFAAAVTEVAAVPLDFTLDSLDRLVDVQSMLEMRSGRHPVLILGMGAYYGETLKRAAGAEWLLEGMPFGDWTPSHYWEGTPLVEPVLPFSAVSVAGMGEESPGIMTRQSIDQREPGRRLLLVYPGASADAAVRRATGPAYYDALKLIDKGDARGALEILTQALLKSPKNRGLAIEAISLCEIAGLHDEAKALTVRAIAEKCEVPEILLRHADALAASDPTKAIETYRKAADAEWPPPVVYLKMGKAYAAAGRREIAEACWRRGFHRAWIETEKSEFRTLLGVAEPDPQAE